nr:MAG TPA: ssDNA binding protein [Caudoviricetes sp.]
MIKVTNQTKEFTEIEKYLMTTAPTIKTVKTLQDGDVINVAGYLEFIDEKEDGTSDELMSIITTDKAVYSTQSVTFKRSIKNIEVVMQFPFPVKKISGQSKAGRKYVDCVLDIESLS